MLNHVDAKVTVWNRYIFTDDAYMQGIIDLIEKEGVEAISEQALGFTHHFTILDTEEQITPEENGGEATIEVFENRALKWKNSPTPKTETQSPPVQLTPYEQKVLSALAGNDVAFCLEVFTSYQQNMALVNNLIAAAGKVQAAYTSELKYFHDPMKECTEVVSSLTEIKQSLNKALVVNIEEYFIKRYKVPLQSFTKDKKDIADFTSIATIIEPMLAQCGQDLMQAGRQFIISCFQDMIIYDEEQPSIQGNVITLPEYYTHNAFRSRSKVYLDKTEVAVTRLLDAICVCFTPHNERPEAFDELHREWQYEIDIQKTYSVLPQVALKFFRNGKINVLFSTEAQARNFWEFFELTGIAARNQRKRNQHS